MAANASPPIVFLFRMKLPFLATLSRPSGDAYEVLELPRDASLEEVEQAYHRLSEYWNPRRNALDEAPAHYQAVRQAATELATGLPPKRPARRRLLLAVMGVVAIVGVVASLLLVPPALSHRSAPTASPRQTAPAAPAPIQPASPDPAQLTLRLGDLPAGYSVLRAGPATTAGQGQPAPSWDAVFQRGTPASAEFQVTESLVLVYPNPADAKIGFDQQVAAGQNASRVPFSLGDESTGWVEPAPSRPGMKTVRLAFKLGNLVALIGVLGSEASGVEDEALGLSAIQAGQLKGA